MAIAAICRGGRQLAAAAARTALQRGPQCGLRAASGRARGAPIAARASAASTQQRDQRDARQRPRQTDGARALAHEGCAGRRLGAGRRAPRPAVGVSCGALARAPRRRAAPRCSARSCASLDARAPKAFCNWALTASSIGDGVDGWHGSGASRWDRRAPDRSVPGGGHRRSGGRRPPGSSSAAQTVAAGSRRRGGWPGCSATAAAWALVRSMSARPGHCAAAPCLRPRRKSVSMAGWRRRLEALGRLRVRQLSLAPHSARPHPSSAGPASHRTPGCSGRSEPSLRRSGAGPARP